MSSEDFQITFDCPKCDKRVSVSEDKEGQTVYCPHCVQQVHVPGEMSANDKLLAGLLDDDEPDHPGSLKIDGISGDAEDGVSWHIKCHICDSLLLVTKAQVGSQVKCNDCYSMLDVKPKKGMELPEKDSASEASESDAAPTITAVSGLSEKARVADADLESDELTLLPPVDLPKEFKSAQSETLIEDVIDELPVLLEEEPVEVVELEEIPDEPLVLADPIEVEKPAIEKVFDLQASENEDAADPDSGDEDSDEEIEIIGVAPEVANQQLGQAPTGSSSPKALPRIPRKGKKQPKAIPVGGEVDAPIRVHAKRKRKKPGPSVNRPKVTSQRYDFESAELGQILDKAMGLLKTSNLWLLALCCVLLMSVGSGIWHSYATNIVDDPAAIGDAAKEIKRNNWYYWGMGSLIGRPIYFLGYVLLLFAGGVVFRETALGKVKIESGLVSDRASFVDTLMLFGFSMFIAAFAVAIMWEPFIVLPAQMLLAGLFLLPAWRNQNPYMIVSGDIGEMIKMSASWRNWFAVTGIAAAGCLFGGALLEVPWPIISFFSSIIGSFVVVIATLLFAAGSGWHCGWTVEKMEVD